MSYDFYRPDVAKYGGSSAAHLNTVLEQDQHPDNQVEMLVLSGPGCDREGRFKERLTDALLNGGGIELAQTRIAAVIEEIDPNHENADIQDIYEEIPADFERWDNAGHAIDALPEYWSAKLYAAYSGREFIDAADIIKLDRDGNVDFNGSNNAIYGHFRPFHQYVVPGYYGSNPDGKIRTLGRGGSDTSGAILAKALLAKHYFNYIDQDGLLSGHPDVVENGAVIDHITYQELRELAIGGCRTIAADAINYLGGRGIDTLICNTFGAPGNRGTLVTESRDWLYSPVASVTGRDDLMGLRLHSRGLNEQIGGTNVLFDSLRERGVSYQHITTSTDNLTVIAEDVFKLGLEAVRGDMQQILDADMILRPYGSVNIVGEGLSGSNEYAFRRTLHATVELELARRNMLDYGDANDGESASLTMFLNPAHLHEYAEHNALRIAHEAVRSLIPQGGV